MWCNTNEFKIFGDGTDKLILVSNGTGCVIHNPFLTEMSIHREYNTYQDWDGRLIQRTQVPGLLSSELHLKCGQIETIQGKDLEKLINPIMNKSVLELMQIVNQKLKERS
jgi:hypothetical protein